MDMLNRRIRLVDSFMPIAEVSLLEYSQQELELAHDLCACFALPLGSLVRRADAIRIAGGNNDLAECLNEAAQHLVLL